MAKDGKPTRKNLLQIEDRMELSERGHDTLEIVNQHYVEDECEEVTAD